MHPTVTRAVDQARAQSDRPSVGLGTVVGLGTGAAGLAGAIVAFIAGDRSEQTLGVIVGAGLAAIMLAVTVGGRMLQAAIANRSPAAAAAIADALDELDERTERVQKFAEKAAMNADSARTAAHVVGRELRDHQRREAGVDGSSEKMDGYVVNGPTTSGELAYRVAGDLELDDAEADYDLDDGPDDVVELGHVPADRRVDVPPVPDEGDFGAAAHEGESA